MVIQVASLVAIYFIVWWLCFFIVLPWGARSQRDANDVHPGSEPGAPALLRLWPKLLVTTIIAAIATWALLWGMNNEMLQRYWS